MKRKNKLAQGICKQCKLTGHAPEGMVPHCFDIHQMVGRAPLGMRVQAAGAAMSVGMSGANKGGYFLQSNANRKTKTSIVCSRCGSKKIEFSLVKVPVDEAIRLLADNNQ